MRAVLIIGGQSRRFWPLTEKALFPVVGQSLVAHQIERLRQGGISEITIVANETNLAAVQAVCGNLPVLTQPTGTIGMHWACKTALAQHPDGPVLIVSGNDMIEPAAYRQVCAAAEGCDGALLAYRVRQYFPGGYLQCQGTRVTAVIEKPGAGHEPSDLVNIVAHVHRRPADLLAAIDRMPDGDDAYERALSTLLPTHHYQAVGYQGVWQPVKYPWHMLGVCEVLLGERTTGDIDPAASVHPTATIQGAVTIGAGSRILPHASLVGPCTIGRHCVIGNGALVRGSSIGDHCVIGFGSEIKSSVLASHVWTHMTYIGDSVIGENVSFGGGCITGNFRLDEGEISVAGDGDTPVATGRTKLGLMVGNHCRFGIRVSSNPGVRIGADSFVTGNLLLEQDIPQGSFVTLKQGVVTCKPNRVQAPRPEARAQYRPQ